MQLSLRLNSRHTLDELRRIGSRTRAEVRQIALKGMQASAKTTKEAVRAHVAARLKIHRRSFVGSFFTKVFAQDPQRLPALQVAGKVSWAGMHETGGVIAGRMLMPLHGRVSRRQFTARIKALRSAGQTYFKPAGNGTLLLMARSSAGRDASGFRKRYRQAQGVKRLARGTDIPLALLVPRVTLKKRLDIRGVVETAVAELLRDLQARLPR